MNPIQLFSFSPGSTPEQQQALILHGIEAPAAEAAVAPAAEVVVTPAESKKKAKRPFAKAPVEATAEVERARDDDGKFLSDDPATPDVDEAWVEVDREN
jgi:hypothetical protein